MEDVELEVAKGSVRFRGRGPMEWVEEQFAKVFNLNSLRDEPEKSDEEAADSNGQAQRPAGSGAGSRKSRWQAQQEVTQEQLDLAFHDDGTGSQLIAPLVPGATNKDRCINAYILVGLRSFLTGKDGRFTDEEARSVCEQYGIYDKNNHSKVFASLKPDVNGSKTTGWQVTNPGLAKAAALVKQIASQK